MNELERAIKKKIEEMFGTEMADKVSVSVITE